MGQNGVAIESASEDLRADIDVALEATAQDVKALRFLAKALRSDSNFVLRVLQQPESARAPKFAPDSLRSDRAFMFAALNVNGRALEFASEDMRADKAIVM